MPRTLLQHDVVGHRLRRIFSSYELLDGYLDHVPVWFELESGVVFQLPNFADETFEEAALPPTAEPIADPAVDGILGARIDRVVRPSDDRIVVPGKVCLHIECGRWLRVEEAYPTGVNYAGLHITDDMPLSDEAVDFWARPAEA
jgi:hypothetical protein